MSSTRPITDKLIGRGGAMAQPIDHAMTTTAFSLDGYRTTKTLGVVRGDRHGYYKGTRF
jgi:hypothetical protein